MDGIDDKNNIKESVNIEQLVPIYYVELLFDEIPKIEAKLILQHLNRAFGDVSVKEDSSKYIVFSLDGLVKKHQELDPIPQIVVVKNYEELDRNRLEMALSQTWDWNEKENAIETSKYKITICDFLSENLARQDRIEIFNKVMKIFVENLDCLAIHWINSLKMVSPETYISAISSGDTADYLYGALNVRLFIVDQENGEFLMDTMGLACLGLPDLQCNFKGLNPEEVAGILINYGYYIFEKGDVIKDGHTIQGLDEEQKWMCEHQNAMALPQRIVLDLNPGDEFAGTKE